MTRSKSLWDRRIAVLSTFHDIKAGHSGPTLEVCTLLLTDREDLIHKATGWMLREVGKRVSRDDQTAFLDEHAAVMPRTMLRYAIEHLQPDVRARYLGAAAQSRSLRAGQTLLVQSTSVERSID